MVCCVSQRSFWCITVELCRRWIVVYDPKARTWLLKVIFYLKIFLQTCGTHGCLPVGQTLHPPQRHINTRTWFVCSQPLQITTWLDIFLPSGDSWADQKAGVEALGTWPLSASQMLIETAQYWAYSGYFRASLFTACPWKKLMWRACKHIRDDFWIQRLL